MNEAQRNWEFVHGRWARRLESTWVDESLLGSDCSLRLGWLEVGSTWSMRTIGGLWFWKLVSQGNSLSLPHFLDAITWAVWLHHHICLPCSSVLPQTQGSGSHCLWIMRTLKSLGKTNLFKFCVWYYVPSVGKLTNIGELISCNKSKLHDFFSFPKLYTLIFYFYDIFSFEHFVDVFIQDFSFSFLRILSTFLIRKKAIIKCVS